MKVVEVNSLGNYKLKVVFEDGASGVVDLQDFIRNGVFSVLEDENLFNKVYATGYSIAWSDQLEIDALTIYAGILNKEPQDLFTCDFNYASN